MKVTIEISSHTRNVIARYIDGTGFAELPIGTIDILAHAVVNGEILPEDEEEDDGCKRTDEEIL